MLAEIKLAYVENVWRPVVARITPILLLVKKQLDRLAIDRLMCRSLWIWMLLTLVCFSAAGILYVQLTLGLADAGINWLEYVWDEWILALYDLSQFHTTWWLIISVVMFALWLLIRPLSSARLGGWRWRYWFTVITYSVLFTISIVLAWRFQEDLIGLQWFFAILLFVVCHFLFVFSIAVVTSLMAKIPALNKRYLDATQQILKRKEQPIKHIFEGSLYSHLVRQMVIEALERYLGKWFGHTAGFKAFRLVCERLVHFVLFAWLVDRVFGTAYYVHHFEMTLRWRVAETAADAHKSVQRATTQHALTAYAQYHERHEEQHVEAERLDV